MDFLNVFFNDMIDSMVDQIKAGKEMIVLSEEYQYLTPEQAAITRETLQLTDFDDITSVMPQIKSSCKKYLSSDKPVVIVDLGVGPAIKPVTLYTALLKDFDVSAYVGVDASEHLLALAKQDIEKYRFDLKTEFLHVNFRQIAKDPSALLDKLPEGQKLFLFLGGTYGSFEQQKTLEFLRSFMKKGDLLIVGAFEVASREDFESRIYPNYQQQDFLRQKKLFHFLPLAELGFREDELGYDVHWNDKEHTQYTLWTVKNVSERVLPQLVQAGIREGHKIRPWMCNKPTAQQFQKELESIGLRGEVHPVKKGQYNLALMRLPLNKTKEWNSLETYK